MDGFGVQSHPPNIEAEQGFAVSGLAATLREAEPGTRVRLVLDDGREITGALGRVGDETVELDENHVELRRVTRLKLEFGSAQRSGARPKQAA
jgi:hypothetical protein